MRLKPFLDRYDTVLLDMDGVITSEEIYWDTAALTVWELLHSKQYFGTETLDFALMTERASEIRQEVFCNDAIIKLVKNRGFNNNWDLAWMVAGDALAQNTRNFQAVLNHLTTLPTTAADMVAAISGLLVTEVGMPAEEAQISHGFWLTVQHCFQEWFLGSKLFDQYWTTPAANPPKNGLAFTEEPIVDKALLVQLLKKLGETKRLGVGTGRPHVEAVTPLGRWGVLNFFAQDALATYQDVTWVQEEFPGNSYTKPHPYMFLKAAFGNRYSNKELLTGAYDVAPCRKILVIGDAKCDLFAAKAAGCDFAAVLTGIEGELARCFFEKEGADYILHNILELLED